MSFVMPDVRNMTETAARAAILAVSVETDRTIELFPAVVDGYWDDTTTLGAASGQWSGGLTAATIGVDGTISAQFPEPGEVVLDPGGMALQFHLWGVHTADWTELDTDLTAWAQSPDTTFYGGLTTGTFIADGRSSFRIELTTLHRPSAPAEVLTVAYDASDPFHQQVAALAVDGEFREVVQFSDPSVREVLNDQTEARFTMSMYDPMVVHVGALECAARIFYRDQIKPIFWAPVTFEEDFAAGTVIVSGINVRRIQKQNLRRGDDAINRPDDQGAVTIDGAGLGLFLLTAQNTPAQDGLDDPSLGITLDDRSASRADTLGGVERGDNTWDKMREWVDAAIGPDFEFDPQSDGAGIYMLMRVWDRRGSDRTANVGFFYNVPGEDDNLANAQTAALQPITHAHVLDAERRYRRTRASRAAANRIGTYVEWVVTTLKIHKKPSTKQPDLEPLDDIAQAYIDAYAPAPRAVTLTLRPDAGQTRFYREHFWPGDHVSVHAMKGYRAFEGDYRIREVELSEDGSRGPTRTALTVVPYVPGSPEEEDA